MVAIRDRWIGLLPFLIPALAAFFIFSPVRDFEFLLLDDPQYVANPELATLGFTPQGIAWAWTANFTREEPHADGWVPLTMMTRLWDVAMHEFDPGGHHTTSLWLHVFTAGIAGLAVRRIFRLGVAEAVLVGVGVAVGAAQIEAVGWLSARKDQISALFIWIALGSYAAFLERPCRIRWGIALLAYLASLLGKPGYLLVPCLLVWMAWDRGEKGKRALIPVLPYFLLAALFGGMALLFQQDAGALDQPLLAVQRLWLALAAPPVYLWRFFWPWEGAILYPALDFIPTPSRIVMVIVGWSILLGPAFILRKRQPGILLGVIFFLCLLLPAGAMSLGFQFAPDRYAVAANAGLWAALIAATRGFRSIALRLLPAGALCAATVLATIIQLPAWRDTESILSHSMSITGPHSLGMLLTGVAYLNEGEKSIALERFREATRIDPDSRTAWKNRWLVARHLGLEEEAAMAYQRYQALSER